MQRWNGWGNKDVYINLPSEAVKLLREVPGPGVSRDDYPLEKMLQRVPDSRLPRHTLISTEPKIRLDHTHGQSLPDWIALRGGTLNRFPDGVAFPNTPEDVRELLNFAEKNNVIIIPYGGGTSVLGHLTVPEGERPVLSLSMKHLNRMIELDPLNCLATFEAGIKGPDLEAQLRAADFTLGHFPQSFEYSSLGGWVVTRASGQESMYYGRMDDLFAGGELLTPKGTMTIPPCPASAAGPDLRHLVLGSEGRLGVLTTVTVRISPLPERSDIYGVFFPSWESAVETVRSLAVARMPLSMTRISNPVETETNLVLAGHETQIALLRRYLRLRNLPEGRSCMGLIGFTGSPKPAAAVRREAKKMIRRNKGIVIGRSMGEAWKKNRFRTPYLRNTLWDTGYAIDTVETAVPWSKVTFTMQSIEKAVHDALATRNETVHIFSHLSSCYPTGSNVYTTFVFRLAETPEETLARWQAIKKAASLAIVAAGGTISHQHGVGIDHKPYLGYEKGPLGMSTIRDICSSIDPDQRMNPTKLV